jgi:Tfp pilus assembly protein PilZ
VEKRDRNRIVKRLFTRFGPDDPVNIGYTGDVSLSGIFIKTNTIFPPGAVLKIEIELPNSKTIHLLGTVMWAKRVPSTLVRHVKKSGMGVRILQPPEDYLKFVANLHG